MISRRAVLRSIPLVLGIPTRPRAARAQEPGRTYRFGALFNSSRDAPHNVAFQIDAIDPAHHQGWSVLVRGTLHRVDPNTADFRERFDPEPWILAERDAWLIVEPFAITGRRLQAAGLDLGCVSVVLTSASPGWESWPTQGGPS